jgi:glycosyltransferase involved in cell wall biosynthesis
VKAFSIIARKNPDISLVFSGKLDTTFKASKYHELISQEIRRMEDGVRNRILFLNNVSRDELKAVYSLAAVFLMPSLEEGFGLPLLEAMRAGVPAVTSKISCMPEVAGDAALLCNPYDIRDIASKVERLLNDRALAKKLSSEAEARAKTFTWKKTAKETIRLYEQEWRKKFGGK